MATSTDLSLLAAQPAGALLPLEIGPPQPHHPFRWRKVWSLLREINADPEGTERVFEIFDAVGGDGGERTFRSFLDSANGEALMQEDVSLVAAMGDRERLAALPAGTLGAAYLDFAQRNGFSADGLAELNRNAEREISTVDPHRDWFFERYTAMHDLWHVVTGCDTTEDGEAILVAFTQGCTPQRGFAILVAYLVIKTNIALSFQRSLWRAWRAGRKARGMLGARWEKLLALPLDQVRSELAVEAPLQ